MRFPFRLVALVPLLLAAGPNDANAQAQIQREGRHLTIVRPGRLPIVILGTDQTIARNELKGTWQVVHLEREGEQLPEVAAGLQMTFERGRLLLEQRDRKTIVVAYRLAPSALPPEFTWWLRVDSFLWIQKGVFWREDDTLMICLAGVNQGRAHDFLTQPDDGRTLFVLKPVKPVTP